MATPSSPSISSPSVTNQSAASSSSAQVSSPAPSISSPSNTNNNNAKFELYSISKYIPASNLVSLLSFSDDDSTTELSAFGWQEEEVVMDELATFFPFPRFFNRTWADVKKYVSELISSSGRLIIIRAITPATLPHVTKFVENVSSLFNADKSSSSSSGDGAPSSTPQGRVVIVLEGFTGEELEGHKVNRLSKEPEQNFGPDTYQIQVSWKRNHKYYVNVALKVLKRRSWYNKLEFSGLGNSIPSIVSIAEILKRYQVVTTGQIGTSLVELSGDRGGQRSPHKAKLVVILTKLHDVPQVYPTGVQEC